MKHLKHPLVPLAALLLIMSWAGSAAVHAGAASYDFEAIYEVDSATGELTYLEQGALPHWMACPSGWSASAAESFVTLDPGQKVEIKIDLASGEAVVELQQNFSIERRSVNCSGVVSPADFDSCGSGTPWDAATQDFAPSPMADGWNVAGSPVGKTSASTTTDAVVIERDLTYRHLRIDHSFDGVPFTGRLLFEDAAGSGQMLNSGSYLSGRCIGPGSTITDCCSYMPTVHAVVFGARPTSGTDPEDTPVGLPPAGPLGSWSQQTRFCNKFC